MGLGYLFLEIVAENRKRIKKTMLKSAFIQVLSNSETIRNALRRLLRGWSDNRKKP